MGYFESVRPFFFYYIYFLSFIKFLSFILFLLFFSFNVEINKYPCNVDDTGTWTQKGKGFKNKRDPKGSYKK